MFVRTQTLRKSSRLTKLERVVEEKMCEKVGYLQDFKFYRGKIDLARESVNLGSAVVNLGRAVVNLGRAAVNIREDFYFLGNF
jgi:hypothetical protein